MYTLCKMLEILVFQCKINKKTITYVNTILHTNVFLWLKTIQMIIVNVHYVSVSVFINVSFLKDLIPSVSYRRVGSAPVRRNCYCNT